MTNQKAIERIKSIKSKVSLYDDVLALRMSEEALNDITIISEALISITERECCHYGFEEACEIAEGYIKEVEG